MEKQNQERNPHIIFFLRHGERADNSLLQAEHDKIENINDVHLTQLGKLQAEEAGKIIKKTVQQYCPYVKKIQFCSSPFLRCLMTAEGVSKGVNLPMVNDEIQTDNYVCEMLAEKWFQTNVLEKGHLILRNKEDKLKIKNYVKTSINDNQDVNVLPVYPEDFELFANRAISGYNMAKNRFIQQQIEGKIGTDTALIIVTHGYGVTAILEELGCQPEYVDYTDLSVVQYKYGNTNNPKFIFRQCQDQLETANLIYVKQLKKAC